MTSIYTVPAQVPVWWESSIGRWVVSLPPNYPKADLSRLRDYLLKVQLERRIGLIAGEVRDDGVVLAAASGRTVGAEVQQARDVLSFSKAILEGNVGVSVSRIENSVARGKEFGFDDLQQILGVLILIASHNDEGQRT